MLTKGSKISPSVEDLASHYLDVQNQLKAICDLLTELNLKGVAKLPIRTFFELLEKLNKCVSYIEDYYLNKEAKLQAKSGESRYYKRFGSEIMQLSDFKASLYRLNEFLEGTTVRLANFPFLLLEGNAGVGKSHLLADIISTRITNNLTSLFFLGQHFVTNEDPWTQIFKKMIYIVQ